MNTGIGRIKLGRALLLQERYDKQTSPSVSWLRNAREDLVKLYTASNKPEQARKFQADVTQ